MHTLRFLLPGLAAACLGFSACIGFTACSGSPGDSTAATSPQAVAVEPPLLDDQGRPAAPQAYREPANAAARTRARLYASESQARQLEASLGDRVISVEVDSANGLMEAVDLAVLTAYGLQAAHDLDAYAPVLVRGKDLRLAAAAANRLHANGYTRVFLVTP